MDKSIRVKFDVWRKFFPPFRCVCCGKEISKEQMLFSCLCGYCDLGKCEIKRGISYGYYRDGHNLELWKEAEIDAKLQILEGLKEKTEVKYNVYNKKWDFN